MYKQLFYKFNSETYRLKIKIYRLLVYKMQKLYLKRL